MRYTVCPDALLHRFNTSWVFSNPRVRRHVEVDRLTVQAVMALASGATERQWTRALSQARGWDRTQFTNAAGLMADPSGCAGTRGPTLAKTDLFRALRSDWILQEQGGRDYESFLKAKTSLLDDKHLGTFHQNLGRYLLLNQRLKKTWRWWHDQKFTPDGLSVRPGLYKWVQEYSFNRYFGSQNLKGLKILDFACGNGYYSRHFGDRGARVTGIDTSPDLIAIARKNHGRAVKFLQPPDDNACKKLLGSFPDASFDGIYISDTLLFFFHDFKSGQPTELLPHYLREFRRLLKDGGTLYMMEPNAFFWLSPWFGNPSRPMALVTEYRERTYQVATGIDRVISELSKAGFWLREFLYPGVDPKAGKEDPQAYAFARSYPVWDFYVCAPAPRRR